ncbi:hypothetical protein FRB98_007623 [Tulasnella sp. 332]|nr:hypothetical protein FRB98_007623 [Tulasnella sp. 332]
MASTTPTATFSMNQLTSALPTGGFWQTALISAAVFSLGVYVAAQVARKYIFVPKYTIMDDLPNLGKERTDGSLGFRAIVCGGSVGGLFAAAMCSYHFDSVLIIEPEASANETNVEMPKSHELRPVSGGLSRAIPLRTRVVQYLASHVFLPPCVLAMRQFFPKMDDDLAHFGITLQGYYGAKALDNVYEPDDPECPKILPVTRSMFETLLRRLVFKYRANVTFMNGTVEKFVPSPEDPTRLSGVSVRTAQGEKVEKASFIVDSTGVGQLSYNKLLRNAGFGAAIPTRIEYDPHLTYAQSVWTIPEEHVNTVVNILPSGMKGTLYVNLPNWDTGEDRAIYFSFFERSQLCIAVGSWGGAVNGNDKPHTVAELREVVKSLYGSENTPGWTYELLDFLEEHNDECKPWVYDANAGKMSNILFHEAPAPLPSNWIAIGDAVTKLNPVYGQGTVKAVIDTTTLDSILRTIPSQQGLPADLPKTFYVKRFPRIEFLWEGTKTTDYGFGQTTPAKGETNADGLFERKLGLHLIFAGRNDLSLGRTFYRVQSCLAPKTDLVTPANIAKVAWNWIKE